MDDGEAAEPYIRDCKLYPISLKDLRFVVVLIYEIPRFFLFRFNMQDQKLI